MKGSYKHTPLIAPGLHEARERTPQAPVAPDDKSIHFAEVWDAIRRGKWIILVTTFLTTAILAAYTLTMDPVYKANSIVSISKGRLPATENVLFLEEQHSLPAELGVLEYSVDLAERVLRRLGETAEARGPDAHFPLLFPEQGEPRSARQTTALLMASVDFQTYGAQNMISIVAESTAPEEAALIANFYAEEYARFSLETSRASVVAAREFLEDQVVKRGHDLQRLQDQWEVFAREKHVITQGEDGERTVTQYTVLQTQRDEAHLRLEQENVALDLLRRQLDQVEPGLEGKLRQERSASELESQINALDRHIADLKVEAEQYYAVNPALKGNDALIARIEPLAEIVRNIAYFTERRTELVNRYITELRDVGGAPDEGGQLGYIARLKNKIIEKQLAIEELATEIAALDMRLQLYEQKLETIPRQAVQQAQMEHKIEQAEKWYGTMVTLLQQTQVAEESELGYVKVVRGAFVPTAPFRPNIKQNIALGFLLGLGLGVALAFVRQAAKTRLSKLEELKDRGFNLIGVVPHMDKEIKSLFDGKETVEVDGKKFSTRLITHLDPWSACAENFRLIRTNIQFFEQRKPIQSLLITSPEVADGKSVMATNIAITMAQVGHRTLLIDGDLRRKGIHDLMGLAPSPGFTDILTHRYTFNEADFVTDVPGLFCLPSGQLSVPPAELFGTDNVKRFLDTIRQQFDVIIIDSPPVLTVTDAVLLALQCDATALVVMAEKTNLRALEITQETLRNLGVHIVGTIVNRFDAEKSQGYGYAYGYHTDYAYGKGAS